MKPHNKKLIHQNRYTLLSMVVILGMYGILTVAYDPASSVRRMANAVTGKGFEDDFARLGGDFTLVALDGSDFTQNDIKGRNTLLAFGCEHCSAAGQQSLALISSVYQQIPEESQPHVQPILVSLDAARDTPESFGTYIAQYSDAVVGLTGSIKQVNHMARLYKVLYNRMGSPEDYYIQQAGYVYLLDADAKYLTHFRYDDAVAEVAETVARFVAQ